jgi:hypothetical protein
MEPKTHATNKIGYALIGAYILVYLGMAVSTAQTPYLNHHYC